MTAREAIIVSTKVSLRTIMMITAAMTLSFVSLILNSGAGEAASYSMDLVTFF